MTTVENPMLTMIREVCGLGRVEFDRPHSDSGDPGAGRVLVAGLQAIDPGGEPSDISLSLPLLSPRAPFFDRLVVDALATGVTQVVNVGSGYDDRALRFRHDGVTYYDLDLPAIVADTVQRLDAAGVDTAHRLAVPVDLRTDDVAAALEKAGHDDTRPSLFLVEHVMLFLEPAVVRSLLVGLSDRAAAGSRVAITAEVHPADLESDTVVSTADHEMFGGVGPLHTIGSRAGWLALLADTGWRVEHPDEVTEVDHFAFPIHGRDISIQTQFITATT